MTKETGGTAFPNASIKTKDGVDVWGEGGMTLRDYFAAKAMQGISSMPIPSEGNQIGQSPAEWLAENSYAIADAMMEARNA